MNLFPIQIDGSDSVTPKISDLGGSYFLTARKNSKGPEKGAKKLQELLENIKGFRYLLSSAIDKRAVKGALNREKKRGKNKLTNDDLEHAVMHD
jgi:hypothetical protein